MKRMLLVIATACSLAYCRREAPRPMDDGAMSPSLLLYYRWSGTSPGTGFSRTTLTGVEVDLRSRDFRRITKVAHAPQPMLPHQRATVAELLRLEKPQKLTALQSERLNALVAKWVAMAPPARYAQPRGLGREDGFVEQMVVEGVGRDLAVTVDPRDGSGPRPPSEWRDLVIFLDALGGEQGAIR